MTLESDRNLTVKLSEELLQKLAARVNGHDVSEYLAALIRADLERADTALDPEFAKSVDLASRFMDRYSDAYRALSK